METDIKALSRKILDEIWNQERLTWSRSTLPSPGGRQPEHNLGDLSGIPATGRRVVVTAITCDRAVNGKFQEAWSHWDALNTNKSPTSGNRGQKRGTHFC